MYVITAEVLACNLRADPNISGVSLPGPRTDQCLISQYADDTNISVTDDDSILDVFHLFNLYECASGARLNLNKCKGLWLGPWKNREDPPVNIVWSSSKIPCLGTFIGPGVTDNDIWDKRISAIESTLNAWSHRLLSFYGKSLILNALVLSRLWYVAYFHYPPAWVQNRINTLCFKFFWSGKRDIINRQTVCQFKSSGGFDVVNIRFKIHALHCQWIKRFFSPSPGKWKIFFIHFLFSGLTAASFQRVFYYPLTVSRARLLPFYKSIVKSWAMLGGGFDDTLGCLAISANTSSALSLPDITTKVCYHHVLSGNYQQPRCVAKFRPLFGSLYWPAIWEQVHIFPLDKRVASFRWKMCHDVLYTNFRLAHLRLRQDPSCHCGAASEDLSHLFFNCILARELIPWIEYNISYFLKETFFFSLGIFYLFFPLWRENVFLLFILI